MNGQPLGLQTWWKRSRQEVPPAEKFQCSNLKGYCHEVNIMYCREWRRQIHLSGYNCQSHILEACCVLFEQVTKQTCGRQGNGKNCRALDRAHISAETSPTIWRIIANYCYHTENALGVNNWGKMGAEIRNVAKI